MAKTTYVRNLEKDDLPSIVTIEERVTGIGRPQYWEKRLEIPETMRPQWTSLVAEVDNRVVGFLLGRAGELEFGLPGSVAWIEIIGVDPMFRQQGIARSLIERFGVTAEVHGIKTIFTLVNSQQWEMQQFFKRLGFVQGKMLHFQKET